MRKITLLFALMVAMVTTAMAQEAITGTISPSAPVSTVWGDGDVTIAFNKAVEYTAPETGIQIVDANGVAVCNVTSLIFNSAKTSAFVMLDNGIYQAGTYTITFPAGTFTSEDGAVSEEMAFTITIEVVVPEPTWWTDYDYTQVTKELNKITISFDNLTEIKINDPNDVWLETSAGTEYDGVAEIVETVDEKEGKTTTNIILTFGDTFTTEGIYTVHIEKDLFTMNGEFNNEAKNLQFRINPPVDVTPLAIVNVSPAAGKASQIGSIIITFNQPVRRRYNPETYQSESYYINLTDDKGNTIVLTETGNYFISETQLEYAYVGENPQMNTYYFYDPVPITAPGIYTLDISQIHLDFARDANYDWNATGYCEGTYTWTIAETGIDSIDAEAENAEIFDITGRRVNEITKAGIYIVNGAKKVIK